MLSREAIIKGLIRLSGCWSEPLLRAVNQVFLRKCPYDKYHIYIGIVARKAVGGGGGGRGGIQQSVTQTSLLCYRD